MSKRKGTAATTRAKTLHVGFKMRPELIQGIDAIAESYNVSRTEAIRRAVELFVRTNGIEAPETFPVKGAGRPATVGK